MALPAVIGAASAVSKIFGKQHPKDEGREETNRRAFNAANTTAGNRDAYRFLKQRSGKFGILPLPPIPEIGFPGGDVGGWAGGGEADEDAYAKYKQLAPRYEAAAATSTAALPGQVVDPTNVGKTPDGLPLGVTGASIGPTFLIVALVAVGALLFTRVKPAAA